MTRSWIIVSLTLLVACSSSREEPSTSGGTDPRGPDLAGGNSGAEGSYGPCEEHMQPLGSLRARSENVGVSGDDLLALANRQTRIPLTWPARDSGPAFDTSDDTLQFEVSASATEASEWRCDDPNYPEAHRPKPHVELPVIVTLRTEHGVLDERFETVLRAQSPERAQIPTITLEPEAVGGSLGRAVADYYTDGVRSVMFELSFEPRGVQGWVGGPFSVHHTRPCAYTEYAYWPADAECWPQRSGEPIDDDAAMQAHLARINRTFEITWRNGDTSELRFESSLTDGVTCDDHGLVNHPVQVHITSADGSIDLTLPGSLSGGPSTIDPWPAGLSDVEPFSLDLSASIALDSAALSAQLGLSKDIDAAIVSLYLSSPVAIDSPELSGQLRVVPIDRSGFATPLPLVTLPGGDSERCFSASTGATPVMQGTIALR